MKKYVVIVFLLFAGASYGQPVIDSMLIDEVKDELYIYGSFGISQGKVLVDSASLSIVKWTDSIVIATIPYTGRGAAGPVLVQAGGYQSESRYISSWTVEIVDLWNHLYSNGKSDGHSFDMNLTFRYDIHSLLKARKLPSQIPLSSSNASRFINSSWTMSVNFGGPSTTIDSFKTPIILYSGNRWFTLVNYDCEGQGSGNIQIGYDTIFVIQNGQGPSMSGGLMYSTVWTAKSSTFLPPPKAIALQNNPSIVAPENHSSGIGTDNIILRWNKLALMDKYHLQVSLDSLFNSQHSSHPQIQSIHTIVDTIIADTQYTLPPLSKKTKYFWRVAGINSEGESRWSDVWNFTTGATADVAYAQAIPFSFFAYPNPASDKLTIAYSVSGNVNVALYDLLGNKMRTLSQQANGAQTAELPIAGLPAGMYVLEMKSAGIHKSMPISIVR